MNDVEESARWYQAPLGDALVVKRSAPGWRRTRIEWPDGLIIGDTRFDGPMTERFTPLSVGLDLVGLACTSPDEVRSWTQTMDQLAIEHGPVVAAPCGWAVMAHDQDNIPVEFFCTTP